MQGTEKGVGEAEIACVLDKTPALIRHNLRLLKEAGMATDRDDNGRCWYLMIKGEEYLAERDLL
jgi:hypothetical protein